MNFYWLLCIFLIPSVHAMEEWNSDAENEDFPSEKGISSLEKNDIDFFYDSSSLKKIKKKSLQKKPNDNDNVDGVILVPKEGKNLTDITQLSDFRLYVSQLRSNEWQANKSINGILVYFKERQNFDEVSQKFQGIWGIKHVCTLNRMDLFYKREHKEGTEIITSQGSPSSSDNRND